MHTLLQAAVSLPRSTIRSSFRASCPGRGWSGPGGHSLWLERSSRMVW